MNEICQKGKYHPKKIVKKVRIRSKQTTHPPTQTDTHMMEQLECNLKINQREDDNLLQHFTLNKTETNGGSWQY